jgi:hypothetical protein
VFHPGGDTEELPDDYLCGPLSIKAITGISVPEDIKKKGLTTSTMLKILQDYGYFAEEMPEYVGKTVNDFYRNHSHSSEKYLIHTNRHFLAIVNGIVYDRASRGGMGNKARILNVYKMTQEKPPEKYTPVYDLYMLTRFAKKADVIRVGFILDSYPITSTFLKKVIGATEKVMKSSSNQRKKDYETILSLLKRKMESSKQ